MCILFVAILFVFKCVFSHSLSSSFTGVTDVAFIIIIIICQRFYKLVPLELSPKLSVFPGEQLASGCQCKCACPK